MFCFPHPTEEWTGLLEDILLLLTMKEKTTELCKISNAKNNFPKKTLFLVCTIIFLHGKWMIKGTARQQWNFFEYRNISAHNDWSIIIYSLAPFDPERSERLAWLVGWVVPSIIIGRKRISRYIGVITSHQYYTHTHTHMHYILL